MKVLFLTNLASPYRVDFFNQLSKYCDLKVLFERKTAKDRNDKWYNYNFGFKSIFLNSKEIGNESSFSMDVIKYLKSDYDHIIIGGYSTMTAMIAIIYLKLKRKKFILNVDGGFIKEENFVKKFIKKFFLSSAAYWLCTGDFAEEYLIYYGAKKEKIYKYPFSSLNQADILDAVVSNDEKINIRKKLNISYKKVILSVGQIIDRKGFDILIKSCKDLKDTGVYIIGGKENDKLKQIRNDLHISNVHYVDFLSKNELDDYYKMSDAFILLTREDIWGLVINEAMAKGLPVVSTSKCGAALELINSSNGMIVDLENDDVKKKIETFMKNDNFNMKGEKALSTISSYTIENMARKHFEILNEISENRF